MSSSNCCFVTSLAPTLTAVLLGMMPSVFNLPALPRSVLSVLCILLLVLLLINDGLPARVYDRQTILFFRSSMVDHSSPFLWAGSSLMILTVTSTSEAPNGSEGKGPSAFPCLCPLVPGSPGTIVFPPASEVYLSLQLCALAHASPSGLITLQMALVNGRSITNKSFVFNDIIQSKMLDFFFVTETWQRNMEHSHHFLNFVQRSLLLSACRGFQAVAGKCLPCLKAAFRVGW